MNRDLKPTVVITSLQPFVNDISAKGKISHRDMVYAVCQDEALATALEDILDNRWVSPADEKMFDIDIDI